MKSTRQAEVSIHAVSAASSFGASAASASGACTSKKIINPRTCTTGLRGSMQSPSLVIRRGAWRHREEAYPQNRDGPRFSSLRDVLCVEGKGAALAVGEPMPQRRGDGAERDVLPGDRGLFEERHLQRLLARF